MRRLLIAFACLCLAQAIRVDPSDLTSDVALDFISALDDASAALQQVKHPALLAEFYYDAAQAFMHDLDPQSYVNPSHRTD
jgi:hypothetical protein